MTTTIEQLQERVLADLRPGEQAYPIYDVRVRWSEAYAPDAECRIHRVGDPPLPEGRFWNGTGWNVMEREFRDPTVLAEEITREWWPEYVERKALREPADMTVEVKLLRRDTWCDGWFSHWTFDAGMTNDEVLASFERYVERILYSGRPENEIGGRLMGAEDRWRWHGCTTGDPQGERTEPPCRCEHCRQRGIVRIDH